MAIVPVLTLIRPWLPIAMASSKTLRTILDGLNSPPFSLELTPVKLDSLTPERLLQTVSDVVTWIQGMPERIDIREESADETAIRLLSALRTLKYPPPKDMDQVQGWRLGILEGRREELYPILAWIFDNVDRLKERVYLARYLTKLDIPPDVEQSSDVSKLLTLVESRMEQFKELHSRIVESRADYVRAEDIRQDLKTMAEEREQLLRRVERSKRKVSKRNDLQKALQLAARLRNEREKKQEVQLQRQEQREGLVVAQQRLSRLERTLTETRKEREDKEPRTLIAKMKRESEVNRYLLSEKLPRDIEHARQGVDDMRRLVGMRDVSKDYIDELQSKIARVKAGIAALEAEEKEQEAATRGDGGGAVGNDEDDSLQLYRHQHANVLRRKATVADSLQAARRQLGSLESEVDRRRTELAGRSGGSANDVVSNVQYKLLLNRLRTKNNAYKKMRAELEECRAEVQILERSIEVLEQRFDEVKEQNRLEGRGIIEEVADGSELGLGEATAATTPQRPRTAKPTITDLSRLKEMVEEINAQLSRRREEIQRLRREIDQFYAEHREGNERFYASQAELEAQERQTIDQQRELETELDTTEGRLQRLKAELERNKQTLVKQRWFVENMDSDQRCEQTMQALEKRHIECLKNISEANRELATLADRIDGKDQKVMWDSLVLILQTKIRLQESRTGKDTPIGDGRFFGH